MTFAKDHRPPKELKPVEPVAENEHASLHQTYSDVCDLTDDAVDADLLPQEDEVDGDEFLWNDNSEPNWEAWKTMLRKKSMGAPIMVSDFLCPCHGRLKLDPDHPMYDQLQHKEARVMIFPGANKDGYWRNEHMVEQVKDRAIPIFEALHPGCKGELRAIQNEISRVADPIFGRVHFRSKQQPSSFQAECPPRQPHDVK